MRSNGEASNETWTMYLIRKHRTARTSVARRLAATLSLAAIGFSLVGCQSNYQQPMQAANNPQGEDEAMARRNWPKQEALFANSKLEAYSKRFPYDYASSQSNSKYAGIVVSPAMFVLQTIWLPFSFIKYPFGSKQNYSTLTVEPTYTGIPDRPALETLDDRSATPGTPTNGDGNAPALPPERAPAQAVPERAPTPQPPVPARK